MLLRPLPWLTLPWSTLPWLVLALLVLSPFADPADVGARVLDVRTAAYREDAEVPRPVAAVRAELLQAQGTVTLAVAVAVIGPDVDPLPGVEGAPGANLRTAEELHFLLADDQLRLETRGGGAVVAGALQTVERGRVPVRRLRADGSLDLAARAPAELPLRVEFRSAALPEGRSYSYLVAGAAPRLLVECERSGDRARIVAIECLAEPRPVAGRRQ